VTVLEMSSLKAAAFKSALHRKAFFSIGRADRGERPIAKTLISPKGPRSKAPYPKGGPDPKGLIHKVSDRGRKSRLLG